MKTESRVHPAYKKGTKDFSDQLNMLLDDGVKCGDCAYSNVCKKMYGGNDDNTDCQWSPNRFSERKGDS
jgi:hypothetical protein